MTGHVFFWGGGGLTEICILKLISLVLALKSVRFPGRLRLKLLMYVTFLNPAVTLHTTRFNVQKFYVVVTLHSYVVYGFQKKNGDLYNINRLVLYNRGGECSPRGTR